MRAPTEPTSHRTTNVEQPLDLASELETCMERMRCIYSPFSDPGKDWSRGGDPLRNLVQRREDALILGKPLSARFRQLWAEWEASSPDQEERARIFQARNKLVELGMVVSKSDTAIQTQLKRKSAELRRLAVETNTKAKAARAYRR
jgi:hypothetical protein